MVRETSFEAYEYIVERDLLKKGQMEAYKIIAEHGPITSGECHEILYRNRKGVAQTRSRIKELKDQGVVSEVGKRPCRVSCRPSYLLQITNHLPTPPPKRKPKDEQIKILVEAINSVLWVDECRCHEAWTSRGRCEPNKFCGELDPLRQALDDIRS